MAKKNKTKVKIKSKSNSMPKTKVPTKGKLAKVKGKLATKVKGKVNGKNKIIAKTKVKIATKVKSKVEPQLKAKTKVVPKAMPKIMSKTMPKAMPKTKINVSMKPSNKVVSKVDFQNWVTPLDDRLLVMISEGEKMTPGGLYIPDTVTDVSGNMKGVVAAVGRGHLDKKGKIRPLDVKKGDQVIFSQFSGSKIEYQGETVIFLRESDVLGIVNN